MRRSVMAGASGLLDARLGVREPGKAAGAHPDPVGEQPFQLEEAQVRASLQLAVHRRAPVTAVVVAEEADHAPLHLVERGDAAVTGKLLRGRLAPVIRLPEEPLRVEPGLAAADRAELAGPDPLGPHV